MIALGAEVVQTERPHTELDFILLKCELLVEGLRLDPSARAGIGELFKEQVHFIYDWDFDHHHGPSLPADIVLPTALDEPPSFDPLGMVENGLIVMFRSNEFSPFLVRREDDRLLLERDGRWLCDVAFTPRPRYYGEATSEGVPLSKIAVHGGVAGLLCTVCSYCHYFKDGDQCRFCSLVPTKKEYRDELLLTKTAAQVAETVQHVWETGIGRGITLTGGILPGRKEFERYRLIIDAIGRARAWAEPENLPVCAVVGAPAPGEHEVELVRLRETGSKYISINLEVGNPHMFAAICPGKAKNGGHENWLRALATAVDIFGAGHVRSNFVPGIEPIQDTLQAFRELAQMGVFTHFFQPWCPGPGSLLEGHRSPEGSWYLRLVDELVRIWEESELTIEQLNRFPGANDSLAFDLWRVRRGLKVPEVTRDVKAELAYA